MPLARSLPRRSVDLSISVLDPYILIISIVLIKIFIPVNVLSQYESIYKISIYESGKTYP